ncbi:CoA-transferase [Streptomyces sp. NPDC048419]|uniref:CoA-transferase n=1 Tax=Streptomyces sp. NPDC048419 TaxID=3365547 RepID=UPI0037218266
MAKVCNLDDAIGGLVQPEMHLHFPSTPSRSNAAIIALARRFSASEPNFVLSTTGFHSAAHLLGLFRLGKKYVSCFFGDNYPTPRPNQLYTLLSREGAVLEHWSLLSYVSAFRAAAQGQPYGTTTPLGDTDLGRRLRQAGRYFEVSDPVEAGQSVGLVSALRPDVTFVHGALGSKDGAVVAYPPYGEGFHSAISAKAGVIATVEKIVDAATIQRSAGSVVIPAGHVTAICEVPGGAYPQPLYTPPGSNVEGYPDDPNAYLMWRRMTDSPELFERFTTEIIAGHPSEYRYDKFARQAAQVPERKRFYGPAAPSESVILRASSAIVRAVQERGHRRILAGIGQSFLASRLAQLRLSQSGLHVPVMIETGLHGVDCGREADPFLLGHRNISRAARLTGIEDVLGAWSCGAGRESCLAVIGAAQIDSRGDINSTHLHPDRVLVGSGGAADLASNAAELIVLTSCSPSRLVRTVDHVTSPGRAVRTVVTELCTFRRPNTSSVAWTAGDLAKGNDTPNQIMEACTWPSLTVDQYDVFSENHDLPALRGLL